MRDVRKYEVFQLADQLVLEVYRGNSGDTSNSGDTVIPGTQ
jgi:hypothetical protein